MKKLLMSSVPDYNHCPCRFCYHRVKKYHLTESLPDSDTISSLKSDMTAGQPLISEETVEHTSSCEFLLKIYHLPSLWKSLHQQNSPPVILTNHIRSSLAIMRTSRKTFFRSRANLWITSVEMTYPKPWTWSVPLCPLIFSWQCQLIFNLDNL